MRTAFEKRVLETHTGSKTAMRLLRTAIETEYEEEQKGGPGTRPAQTATRTRKGHAHSNFTTEGQKPRCLGV